MARKGVNCKLSYDERRKYNATIGAANRLRHWLCEVMERHDVSDPDYSQAYSQSIKVCKLATMLQVEMEKFKKLYL